jgi:hypothetical protein
MTNTEKVIFSKELEEVINPENVFGRDNDGKIPIVIWSHGASIYTEVISANIGSNKAKLSFRVKPNLANLLLINKDISRIIIGYDSPGQSRKFDNCKIKSLTVAAEGDMYLCRLIVETGQSL